MSDWEDAKCKDDGDLWFKEDKDSKKRAIAICYTCKEKDACLEYALLHNIKDGVWGGTTPSVRHKLRIYNYDKIGKDSNPIIIDSRKNIEYSSGSTVWFKKGNGK